MGRIPDPGEPPKSFEQKEGYPTAEVTSAMMEAMGLGLNNLEAIGYAVAKTGYAVEEVRWVRQVNMYTFQSNIQRP